MASVSKGLARPKKITLLSLLGDHMGAAQLPFINYKIDIDNTISYCFILVLLCALNFSLCVCYFVTDYVLLCHEFPNGSSVRLPFPKDNFVNPPFSKEQMKRKWIQLMYLQNV